MDQAARKDKQLGVEQLHYGGQAAGEIDGLSGYRGTGALIASVGGVDQLLLSWAEQGTYVPLRGSGALPGLDGFTWQTRLASRASRSALGVAIVRFEVRAERAPDAGGPILAIELPVPASVDTGAEREAR